MNHIKLFESFRSDYDKIFIDYKNDLENAENKKISSINSLLDTYRNMFEDYLLSILDKYKVSQIYNKDGYKFSYHFIVNKFDEIENVDRELMSFSKKMKENCPNFTVTLRFRCIYGPIGKEHTSSVFSSKKRSIEASIKYFHDNMPHGTFKGISYGISVVMD